MNKTIKLISALLLFPAPIFAWESNDGQHSTSASVALSSDYVWRGYSQTDNEPAISGSFDYAHQSGLYLGTWASNVDFALNGDQAHIEMDAYIGYANQIGNSGIDYDVGVLRYIYPGTDGGDWNEVYGNLSYHYFSLFVGHSGDVYGSSESGTYYNLVFAYPLPADITLGAAIGYYDYDKQVFGSGAPDSANDYRISLSKEFAGFGLELSYTDTDSDGEDLYGSNIADDRFVFSISKSM
ncbi:MAG TPA: TorF family putative porin [Methylotenera sp.]|nr:TorF family putative porin [Methylotenera sp.]